MKVGRLLAAAAEQIRIAAFETYDLAPVAGKTDEQGIDLVLRYGMAFGLLADADPSGPRRDQRQDRVGHQAIIDNDVGLIQQTARLERQQIRISRPGADQVDNRCFGHRPDSRTRRPVTRAAGRPRSPDCVRCQ
jgi:hypothetical protein